MHKAKTLMTSSVRQRFQYGYRRGREFEKKKEGHKLSNEQTSKPEISGMEHPEFAAYYMDEHLYKIQKVHDYALRYKQATARALSDLEFIRTKMELYGDSYTASQVLHDLKVVMDKHDSIAMQTCSGIYYQYAKPVSMSPFRDYETAEEEDLKRYGEAFFGIRGALVDGKLFYTLPLLSRRIPYVTRDMNGGAYTQDYSTIFSQDIARWTKKLIAELGRDCAEFKFKTLTFFFVYRPEMKQMLDSDSHDTKATIDAITSFFPFGDAPGYCDILYKTRTSDTLIPGTYICVERGLSAFQNDTILDLFATIFPPNRMENSCANPAD